MQNHHITNPKCYDIYGENISSKQSTCFMLLAHGLHDLETHVYIGYAHAEPSSHLHFSSHCGNVHLNNDKAVKNDESDVAGDCGMATMRVLLQIGFSSSQEQHAKDQLRVLVSNVKSIDE